MLISRTLAKRRIAANLRPSFWGAWLPVFTDLLLVLAILILCWLPFFGAASGNLLIIVLAGFAFFFLPVQAVVIVSSMWAAKSRWEDLEQPQDVS